MIETGYQKQKRRRHNTETAKTLAMIVMYIAMIVGLFIAGRWWWKTSMEQVLRETIRPECLQEADP